jgi:hypothetical protein
LSKRSAHINRAARSCKQIERRAARRGIIVGGGEVGGILAGMGVSVLCGPGAPICAIAVVLVGSVAGGVAGGVVADSLDEELEEFSHWDIF